MVAKAYPDRTVTSPILEEMLKASPGDKKSLMKFWLSDKKVEAAAQPGRPGDHRQAPDRRPRRSIEDEITDRLFLPMLLEATRVLEEGIVREPADVDMGLILGIGFPPFRGGILRWCDSLGASAVVEQAGEVCTPGQAIRADRVVASAGEDGRDVLSAPQAGRGLPEIRTLTAGGIFR